MKTHTVSVNDLTDWKKEHRALFASSTKERKRLFATLNGGYEIEVNGFIVLECIQANQAVEKYNSIV